LGEGAMSRWYRHIASGGIDDDAKAYLSAIKPFYSPTWFDDIAKTESQWNKIASDLFESQKDFHVYDKNKAFYPLAGGTPESIRYNARDPRNLNEAFRLTAVGSPTVTSFGVEGNGSSQFYQTHLIPLNEFSLNDASGFCYINKSGNRGYDFASWGGAFYGGGFTSSVYINTISQNAFARVHSVDGDFVAGNQLFTGFSGINRINSTQSQLNLGGTINTFNRNSVNRSRVQIYLMAFNDGGGGAFDNPVGHSNRGYGFFNFGEGLDTTEQGNLKTIIETFQLAIRRAV